MCNTTTKNISSFWIAQFMSSSYNSIGGQFSKEIIGVQVQQLINKNRIVDRLKIEVIGLLSPSKLGTSIVTVYWKPQ